MIADVISKLMNIVLDYKREQWISRKFRVIRTLWLKSQLKKIGSCSRIGKFERLIGLKFISIGERTIFNDHIFLTAWIFKGNGDEPEITIGNDCNFGAFNHITCSKKVIIGNNCLTGKWVTITDNSHGEINFDAIQLPTSQRPIFSKGPVIIEDNVWIGDKVTICPNVRVGKNAIIGANAVVTRDVPENTVVVGNPAKVIKILKQKIKKGCNPPPLKISGVISREKTI